MLGTPEARAEEAACCKESTPTLWAMFMIPPRPTLELLSSMLLRPIQQFPAFISQPPKDTLATGPSSELLLWEVTLISSHPRITLQFQMICTAIALDKLDRPTGRKGLGNCLWKIKCYFINSCSSIKNLFHITTGYWEKLGQNLAELSLMHTFDLTQTWKICADQVVSFSLALEHHTAVICDSLENFQVRAGWSNGNQLSQIAKTCQGMCVFDVNSVASYSYINHRLSETYSNRYLRYSHLTSPRKCMLCLLKSHTIEKSTYFSRLWGTR